MTEDNGGTPLSISISIFLCCRSPPLYYVPYPPRSHCRCRPLVPLRISVFCRHLHTCQAPCIFTISLLPILLSGTPAAIISPSTQHILLPLICANSTISYPYTPTHPLPLYLTPLYLCLSTYIYPLTHFISPLSLTHSLYLYIYFSSTS